MNPSREMEDRDFGLDRAAGVGASYSRLQTLPLVVRAGLYAAAVALAHLAALALRLPEEPLIVLWPPIGVALAVLIVERPSTRSVHLPWIFGLDVAFGLAVAPLEEALLLAVVGLAELLVAAWMLARLGVLARVEKGRIWRYASLSTLPALIAPALAAVPLAWNLNVRHGIDPLLAWRDEWIAHALGIVLYAPALLSLARRRSWPTGERLKRSELVSFAGSFLLLGVLATDWLPFGLGALEASHLLVASCLWSALRFDWRVSAWTLVAGAFLVVFEARTGAGSFAVDPDSGRVLVAPIQMVLAAVALPTLLLGAVVIGLRVTEHGLREEISARARSDEKRQEIERGLQKVQRLEAVGQLASGVAHDMNNSLQLAHTHLDLVRVDEPIPEETLDALHTALRQVGQLSRSLLRISRSEDSKKESVDLVTLVAFVADFLEHSLPGGVNLRVALPEGGPLYVRANEMELHQVLINLVLNARDAMPRGGTIELHLDREALETPHGALDAELATLHVTDEGPGIPTELHERVFEPFFTTKDARVGTGLGLAVVESAVRGHGGSVAIESSSSAGTTFVVRLPLLEAVPAALPAAGGVVLLVEHDQKLAELFERRFSLLGYECVHLETGQELLELFDHGAPEISHVLLDGELPVLGGPETLERLRHRGFDVPVVLASALPAHEAAAHEHDACWLPMPFTLEALAGALNQPGARRSA